MQIFGNVRIGGIRLTELADRAQLSLAATSELVNDLEEMGYLVRRPDPADGRAKLIDLTKRGRDAMAAAGDRVADIERRWSKLVGAKDFAQMCRTMQRLLDELRPAAVKRSHSSHSSGGMTTFETKYRLRYHRLRRNSAPRPVTKVKNAP